MSQNKSNNVSTQLNFVIEQLKIKNAHLSAQIESLLKNLESAKQENLILRAVIDEIPASVYWKNVEGKYLGRNVYSCKKMLEQGFEKVINKTSVVGKTDFDLLPEEIAEQFRLNDMKIMASNFEDVMEESFINKNGKHFHHVSIKKALIDEKNDCHGIVGISLDITQHKQAEEREKKALIAVAEANAKAELEENLRQAVTVVAGRIAHDLRTPLGILSMMSQQLETVLPIILEGYQLAKSRGLSVKLIDPPQYHFLEALPGEMQKEIKEVNLYINSTLKILSKIVAGKIEKEDLEVYRINSILDRALNNYPYHDNQKCLVLWERGEDFDLLGNDVLLIHAFYNLIKNSLHQIEKNQKGKVYLSTQVEQTMNTVRFKDTAGGVNMDIINRFFSKYKTNKEEGTGIGLASVQQTMEIFNGEIVAHLIEGDCVEFIFYFPKFYRSNV